MIRALFSFEGRMSRQPFWLWSLAMVAALVVVMIPYFAFVEIRYPGISDALIDQKANNLIWIMAALSLWPSFAITIKRLADRDRPWWWSIPMLVPGNVQLIAADLTQTESLFTNNSPGMLIIDTLMVVSTLWLLIECGFMRGTAGANQYGPDPLDKEPQMKTMPEAA